MFDVISCQFRGPQGFWGISALKFIERVLIPEAALALIQLDLGLSNTLADRSTAQAIKDESTKFGNMKYKLD